MQGTLFKRLGQFASYSITENLVGIGYIQNKTSKESLLAYDEVR
jgi:hypothetical protein